MNLLYKNITFVPIALILIFIADGCKKHLRNDSIIYDAKSKLSHVPFTLPLCNPNTSYVRIEEGSAIVTNGIVSKSASGINGDGIRTLKLNLMGGYYVELYFRYFRPQLSANYSVVSDKTNSSIRGFNEVSISSRVWMGLNDEANVNSEKGGTIHLEYIQNSGKYIITACEIPVTLYHIGTATIKNAIITFKFDTF